jgi:hypothetical protein
MFGYSSALPGPKANPYSMFAFSPDGPDALATNDIEKQ